MKRTWNFLAGLILALAGAAAQGQGRPAVLFIGNSFTYADGSAVRFYRPTR